MNEALTEEVRKILEKPTWLISSAEDAVLVKAGVWPPKESRAGIITEIQKRSKAVDNILVGFSQLKPEPEDETDDDSDEEDDE